MVLDIFYPGFVKQFQTLFEAVKQRRAARPAFPCKGSRFERLVAVGKIPRRLDRYPSDECWLYAFPGAVGKIDDPAALGGAEPFMARTAGSVHILIRKLEWHRSKALDDVNAKQGIDGTCRQANAFQVSFVA